MAAPGPHRGPGPLGRGRARGGRSDEASGRTRGGFGTKLPIAVDGLGNPVEFTRTGGRAADVTRAEALIAGHVPAAVVADKGSDGDAPVGAIERRGAAAVIPPRPDRTRPRTIDRHLDRERNPAERHIGRIKRDRRVATRDGRTARDFLAFVHVASIMTLLL